MNGCQFLQIVQAENQQKKEAVQGQLQEAVAELEISKKELSQCSQERDSLSDVVANVRLHFHTSGGMYGMLGCVFLFVCRLLPCFSSQLCKRHGLYLQQNIPLTHFGQPTVSVPAESVHAR